MMFCPNCGVQIDGVARFCPNCGTALAATVVSAVNNTVANGNYRVILVSRGLCTRADAINLIEDLFAYSQRDAATIVDGAPMEVACALTKTQAQYILQAMSEYGMDVSVYNQNGYVDMRPYATQSVYDSNGSLLSSVATALLGLGAINRVTRYERWAHPAPPVFRPVYRRAAPVPRRRLAFRPAPPRPVPPRPAPAGGVRRGPQTMPGRPVAPGMARPAAPGAPRPAAPAGRPDAGPQKKPGGPGGPGGVGRR